METKAKRAPADAGTKKMVIDRKIGVKADPAKVWDVLTKNEYTGIWVKGFSSDINLVSDWKLDSPVLWKDNSGKVMVEGNVKKIEDGKILSFTVYESGAKNKKVAKEEGMTFELIPSRNRTRLHLIHGAFPHNKEGKRFYEMSAESWKKILPKIKELSEHMKNR